MSHKTLFLKILAGQFTEAKVLQTSKNQHKLQWEELRSQISLTMLKTGHTLKIHKMGVQIIRITTFSELKTTVMVILNLRK